MSDNTNISAWSIRRPIPSVVLFLVLMALGFISFKDLPITRIPNVDIPLVTVSVTQSGAAPAELELIALQQEADSPAFAGCAEADAVVILAVKHLPGVAVVL